MQPPGCWLDASAVLVRQYLGFCIDTAVRDGILTVLPPSARELAEDMDTPGGHMPRLFDWIAGQEPVLIERFLSRYTSAQVGEAARARFKPGCRDNPADGGNWLRHSASLRSG